MGCVHLLSTAQLLRYWNQTRHHQDPRFTCSALFFAWYLLFIIVVTENPAMQNYAIERNLAQSIPFSTNYYLELVVFRNLRDVKYHCFP